MRFEVQGAGSAVRACDRHYHQHLSYPQALDSNISSVHHLDDRRSVPSLPSTLFDPWNNDCLSIGLAMYFCYGIKNSTLECPEGVESTSKSNEWQQPIELAIPETRLRQTGVTGVTGVTSRANDAINKPNGFTSTLSSSFVDSQSWQAFN